MNRSFFLDSSVPAFLSLFGTGSFLISLSLAVFLFEACSKMTSDPSRKIIAKINGDSVYFNEFLSNFSKLKAELDPISQKNPKLIEELKIRALNEVIVATVVHQEARRRNIKVEKEEIDGRLSNLKESYPPGGFEEMLKKQNLSESFLRNRIEDQLIIEKYISTVFATETLVSKDEMKTFFDQHQNEFFRPSQVHAFQILVPTVEEAVKIRQEIESNQITFELAARKYSLSPDAATGGDLGFFSENEKIAAFNTAFSLSLGVISQPLKSKYGVHLIKVVEKKRSQKLGFLEAKDELQNTIKKQKELSIFKEWVTKLLKDGEFYRNETLFSEVS